MNRNKILMWLCEATLITLLISCSQAIPAKTPAMMFPATSSAITEGTVTALPPTETEMPFKLTSSGFQEGETIPRDFACTGANKSPQLDWLEPPDGTQSLALIFNDPDAGSQGFVHWVVYNIPRDARSLWEGIPANPVIHDSAVHGSNSWGRMDYGGPCPPEGSTHKYVFTLYALDVILDLEPGATKAELEEVMRLHILATATLSGSFGR